MNVKVIWRGEFLVEPRVIGSYAAPTLKIKSVPSIAKV